MAFTISHLVVAPLIFRLSQQQLPLAALMIGTMLPDLARVIFNSPINHHFSGMFSINLLCGLLFYFLWQRFYQPVLYTLAEWQTPKNQSFNLKNLLLICLALLIGNFSHLLWDSFTHLDDRTWFAHQFLAISISIFGQNMPMHLFLQYTTSLIALPLLYYSFRPMLKQKRITPLSPYLNRAKFYLYILLSTIFAITSSAIYFYYFPISHLSFYAQITLGFKALILNFIGIFSLICLILSQHLKHLRNLDL